MAITGGSLNREIRHGANFLKDLEPIIADAAKQVSRDLLFHMASGQLSNNEFLRFPLSSSRSAVSTMASMAIRAVISAAYLL